MDIFGPQHSDPITAHFSSWAQSPSTQDHGPYSLEVILTSHKKEIVIHCFICLRIN